MNLKELYINYFVNWFSDEVSFLSFHLVYKIPNKY